MTPFDKALQSLKDADADDVLDIRIIQQRVVAVFESLSTTPARAEAQDEGARHLEMLRDMETASRGPFRQKAQNTALKWAIEKLHPSPTPAADADRVRIAVEALETAREDIVGWFEAIDAEVRVEHEMHVTLKDDLANIDQALAALKSAAAKEGGEG